MHCCHSEVLWLLCRFLSDELLGTLGNVYQSAARLTSELTQRGADQCNGYWTRTQKEHPEIEGLLLDKVKFCLGTNNAAVRTALMVHGAGPCQDAPAPRCKVHSIISDQQLLPW